MRSFYFPRAYGIVMGCSSMVAKNVKEALRAIAETGASKGLEVKLDEENERLVLSSKECPISVVVEPSNEGFKVELSVGSNLRECVEELLAEDVDPRDELESLVETLVSVVDYAVRKLSQLGVSVKRKTRQGILDVYDTLESFLEEEE